jgi:hypothetical protein
MSKALIHSNIHLRDTKKRKKFLERNIRSSSAVEGIWVTRDAQTGRFIQKESSAKTIATHSTAKSSRSQS